MAAVTVTTTPTLLYTDTGGTGGVPSQVVITNNGGASVFLSTSPAVTTASGIELPTGGTLGLELTSGKKLYGVVAVGTNEVRAEAF